MKKGLKILILGLHIAFSACFIFQNQHKLIMNSSYYKEGVAVSISSYSPLQQQTSEQISFTITSPQLLQNNEPVRFTHQTQKLGISPPISTQNILYNDITEGEHWIGFKKYLKSSQKEKTTQTNFLLVTAQSKNEQHLLLPLMRMPMTAFSLQYFVKCDQALIGLDQSKGYDDLIVFSRAYNNIKIQGEWDFKLFNSFSQSKSQSYMKNIYYNRFRRNQLSDIIRVRMIGQQAKLCNIISEQVKNKRPFQLLQSLNLGERGYISLQQVFQIVQHILPVRKLKPYIESTTDL